MAITGSTDDHTPGGGVNGWLAEPILWDFGAPPGGIPLPRVLAPLWEQRQDVRRHFPNSTPAEVLNYLAWRLTQGVDDRCVPVDLTEPGLAPFLDMPDPELGCHSEANAPPVTRLCRMGAAIRWSLPRVRSTISVQPAGSLLHRDMGLRHIARSIWLAR